MHTLVLEYFQDNQIILYWRETMTKITVGLCAGTSCHLMGGMDLGTVIEELKVKLGDDLQVQKHTCLNQCRKGPNVMLNGMLFVGMTPEQLKNEILALHDREEENNHDTTGQ
ncbi:MAG TPA: hypothetical protein DIT32_07260 [Peptococcaceae bacterium]|nr:hypothetical protein [Peptococcaceae bacterium]